MNTFLNFVKYSEISVKFWVFWYHIRSLSKIFFLLLSWHIFQTWTSNATRTAQIIGFFYKLMSCAWWIMTQKCRWQTFKICVSAWRAQNVPCLSNNWHQLSCTPRPESEFVNVFGAHESIQRNRFRQAGIPFLLLKRFTKTGSGLDKNLAVEVQFKVSCTYYLHPQSVQLKAIHPLF